MGMNIFWFRRDLRLEDNIGLYHSLKSDRTLCIFIFDSEILSQIDDIKDKRVSIIYDALEKIHCTLQNFGSSLRIYYGKPNEIWKQVIDEYSPQRVFFNKDYEPYAIKRDQRIVELLTKNKIEHFKYLDHLIFKPNEVLKADKTPYTVFTPYSRKWKEKFIQTKVQKYSSEELLENTVQVNIPILTLSDIGFEKVDHGLLQYQIDPDFIKDYAFERNYPAKSHNSNLGAYLRFGMVSIRNVVNQSHKEEIFLNELIWREFYAQIMYHFPYSMENSFKRQYDYIVWNDRSDMFEKWCQGQTGYPIVDAGMRELNATGRMHNRVRMIVSSFLTKNLWIDWRLGERYFASKLLDFELASNVGGWQWAASSGCDAVPYFRIFNPTLQTEKFDPKYEYISKWVPEWNTESYPKPIVDFKKSRDEAIIKFKKYLKSN